ncbi:hypothetical protein PIB30_006415 [Stylosanthes scabra]|uniref:Uncharacterized protein n=1 Tax=Stylosanthes scabra TaxID=79078 RepID=A0ABU6T681_9FABA|nr:hypothetical protein [Stylosanthes scabra]
MAAQTSFTNTIYELLTFIEKVKVHYRFVQPQSDDRDSDTAQTSSPQPSLMADVTLVFNTGKEIKREGEKNRTASFYAFRALDQKRRRLEMSSVSKNGTHQHAVNGDWARGQRELRFEILG